MGGGRQCCCCCVLCRGLAPGLWGCSPSSAGPACGRAVRRSSSSSSRHFSWSGWRRGGRPSAGMAASCLGMIKLLERRLPSS
ncbi:hypothetical protein APY03_1763 [Variovorax sp. WDL1]|nr:hypothetical protein APY03_1763 [Variovorax sp. WDL1]